MRESIPLSLASLTRADILSIDRDSMDQYVRRIHQSMAQHDVLHPSMRGTLGAAITVAVMKLSNLHREEVCPFMPVPFDPKCDYEGMYRRTNSSAASLFDSIITRCYLFSKDRPSSPPGFDRRRVFYEGLVMFNALQL